MADVSPTNISFVLLLEQDIIYTGEVNIVADAISVRVTTDFPYFHAVPGTHHDWRDWIDDPQWEEGHSDEWINNDKDQVPWALVKQGNKFGYVNNPYYTNQATEKHEPCGYWRETEDKITLEGWSFRGVEWPHAIVTVGIGKQYTALATACSAASGSTMFLIYAGTYSVTSQIYALPANSIYCFKAMESGVTITNSSTTLAFSGLGNNKYLWFEGITLTTTSVNMQYDVGTTVDVTIVFNRCTLLKPFNHISIKTTTIYWYNCTTSVRSLTTVGVWTGGDLTKVHISRSILKSFMYLLGSGNYSQYDTKIPLSYNTEKVLTGSFVASNKEDTDYWLHPTILDLGDVYNIDRIDVTMNNSYGAGIYFYYLYSTNGTTWTEGNFDESWNTFPPSYPGGGSCNLISPVTRFSARYIKFKWFASGASLLLTYLSRVAVNIATGAEDLTGYGVEYGEDQIKLAWVREVFTNRDPFPFKVGQYRYRDSSKWTEKVVGNFTKDNIESWKESVNHWTGITPVDW